MFRFFSIFSTFIWSCFLILVGSFIFLILVAITVINFNFVVIFLLVAFVIVLSIIDVVAVVVVLKHCSKYFSWDCSFLDLVFGTLSLSYLLLWYTVESLYSFAHFNVYLMSSFFTSLTMPAFSLLAWTLKPKCITFCFPDGKFLRLHYLLKKSKLWQVLAKPHFKSKTKVFVPTSNAYKVLRFIVIQ